MSTLTWPPLKTTFHPLTNRPIPRQRRDLRPEKGFGRYWQRLMRKHRQQALLRRTAIRPTMRIPFEVGDQGAYQFSSLPS